ncbi:MAG: vWA domain-containing protein [Bacillota bacterium]|nr:VWA domain-containing protein [Clostridia bacterium]
MEKRLLKFVGMLRGSGVRVSPGELTDCLKALQFFGISDRGVFYRILKATLIKAETDWEIFDLAFRLFFLRDVEKPPVLISPGTCDGFASSVDGSGTGKAGMGAASRQLYQAVRERNGEVLSRMLLKQLAQLRFQDEKIDELVHRVKIKMEWFMVENAIQREGREGEADYQVLKDLEDYLKRSLEKSIVKKQGEGGIKEILSEENLRTKDLGALNESQIKEMEKRIDRLAHILASRYSYRLKSAKTGRINMRRMLQYSARTGRIPERLYYHDKVMNKPSLIVLCDVSGSVHVYSAFLLQLVYTMARRFNDIRTFLFVDEVTEVTPDIKKSTVQEGVSEALSRAKCSRLGISNFGQVFEIFRKKYQHVLDQKSILIILGDAKNNWYPPREEELIFLSQQVKRVIWLNPEPIEKWNKEDSIIGRYAPSCSDVLECRNLEQLERAVSKII